MSAWNQYIWDLFVYWGIVIPPPDAPLVPGHIFAAISAAVGA